ERPGGAVVAVHEGQQGIAEGAQAGEVTGGEDFLLDDGENDGDLVEPGCMHRRVDHATGRRPGSAAAMAWPMDRSSATSMTRTPRSSTSTSRISPGPGNGSRRASSWRRPGGRGSSGESSISPTGRSVPQPSRYRMTAAEFQDRG